MSHSQPTVGPETPASPVTPPPVTVSLAFASPNTVQSVNTAPPAASGGAHDFASMVAFFTARDKVQEERYKRLEAQLEEQKRSTTEALNDYGLSLGETLRVPASAVKGQQQQRAAARRVDFSSSAAVPEDGNDEQQQGEGGASSGRMTDQRAASEVLKQIKGYVPIFYGNVVKDKGTTVDDFVEKIESAMADMLSDHPRAKLAVVRMLLQEGALRWLNGHLEQLLANGVSHPDWERDVRKPFIDKHNRNNTAELWLTKLQSLRLGKGATPTPIELDDQFDMYAQRLFPRAATGDNNLMLSTEYGNIIQRSNPDMYAHIMRNAPHTTLYQWKQAVAQQWNADAVLKAAEGRRNTQRGGEGWRGGRGGAGGTYPNPSVKPTTLSAVGTDAKVTAEAGMQGEEYTEEGQANSGTPQLNAANSSRHGRGGRGGRGGRVRVDQVAQDRGEKGQRKRDSDS